MCFAGYDVSRLGCLGLERRKRDEGISSFLLLASARRAFVLFLLLLMLKINAPIRMLQMRVRLELGARHDLFSCYMYASDPTEKNITLQRPLYQSTALQIYSAKIRIQSYETCTQVTEHVASLSQNRDPTPTKPVFHCIIVNR